MKKHVNFSKIYSNIHAVSHCLCASAPRDAGVLLLGAAALAAIAVNPARRNFRGPCRPWPFRTRRTAVP